MVARSKLKMLIVLSAGAVLIASCKNTESTQKESGKPESEIEKVSYILGYSTGKSLKDQSVEVDSNLFLNGLKDGSSGDDSKAKFTEDQMREVMQAFRNTLREKREKEREVAATKNQADSEKFLTENKAKEGIVTLESGLQYKVIKEGTGAKPKEDDSVVVEYVGSLIDGKVFDSTKEHGQPATLPVNGTVKGMSEALKLMPVGAKWELYIPASLAYGEQGAGNMIGPNQVLKFEIELVSIKENTPEPEKSTTQTKDAKKKGA